MKGRISWDVIKPKILWGITALLVIWIVIYNIIPDSSPPGPSSWGFKFDINQTEYPPYVEDWIKDCDVKGNGFYVLKLSQSKAEFMMEDNSVTSDDGFFVCVYFNQGDDDTTIKITNYGGGTGVITIPYESTTDKGGQNSTLTGAYAFNCNIKELNIFLDNVEIDYSLSELE